MVPAFAFQPHFPEPQREFDLEHQFLREFGEELLGMEELTGRNSRAVYDWFYDDPRISPLMSWRTEGRLSVRLTGFGFDAVNGEPNVSLLAQITADDEWPEFSRRLQKGWEAVGIAEVGEQTLRRLIGRDSASTASGSLLAIVQGLKVLEGRGA